jgi:hypothetical protein
MADVKSKILTAKTAFLGLFIHQLSTASVIFLLCIEDTPPKLTMVSSS